MTFQTEVNKAGEARIDLFILSSGVPCYQDTIDKEGIASLIRKYALIILH